MRRAEIEETVLVKGKYNFFANSGTFTQGPNIVSAILNEKQAQQSDLLRITDRTRIARSLASTILKKGPLLIYNEGIHIENLPNGTRTWVKNIVSIKLVPEHWIFAYYPESNSGEVK
jgi:hypothetical protein